MAAQTKKFFEWQPRLGRRSVNGTPVTDDIESRGNFLDNGGIGSVILAKSSNDDDNDNDDDSVT